MSLIEGFKNILDSNIRYACIQSDVYNACVRACKEASAQEISDLVREMEQFKDDQGFSNLAGHYFSAAINRCTEETINLDVRELPPLRQLCFFLQRKIVNVTGNVGSGLCQNGRFGLVHLVGSAVSLLGQGLCGAEIIVDGDGGGLVGDGMRSGIIRLNQTYRSLGRLIGGEIYHLGNRIV